MFAITGASSGIGAATARHAVEAGYRVVLAARSKDKLDALVEELARDALAVETDVTRWEDNERLISAAVDAFGRVDVVFANAGFGAKRGWLEETPEHWRDMVLTNVLGAAYTVRAAIPALKASRGHVLLTGSVAGRRALPGSLYSSTKWAVTGDVGVDPRRPQRHRHPDDADLPGRRRRRRSSTTRPTAGSSRTTSRAPCSTPCRSLRTWTSTRSSSARRRRSSSSLRLA